MNIQKNKIPILMYHSISHTCNSRFRQFTVSPKSFAEQMAYLYQSGYTPITVTQLTNVRSNAECVLPKHTVVLTFDDGFADFFTEALPVLMRYNFTATLYLPTAFIGRTSRWLQREGEDSRPMLTWHQMTEIGTNGIEFGGHSHSHRQLDILSHTQAQEEVVLSKEILEYHLRQKVTSFAYPFGYHTAALRRLVREAGYTSACAVKHTMSSKTTDPFALARLMIQASTDINSFAALLGGHNSSNATMINIYRRARTPLWQFARRSSASLRYYTRGTTIKC
jgi:peptidoglycan/xylan/chitin deacetylase (PgdA/CDA1 family)